jgi:hypothetical protein
MLALEGALAVLVNRDLCEVRRIALNADGLMDCDVAFAAKAKSVIHDLEAQGFRPWIRGSWRSVEAQEQAFNSSRSELRLGFHNITGPRGERRGFAMDVIEDQDSKNTSAKYAISLALAARKYGLATGILWGLNSQERAAVGMAIETQRFDKSIKLGWDPCHLEPQGLTLTDALAQVDGETSTRCPSRTRP